MHAVLHLGRHGVEQEAQRRLDILAVNAAVFLVGHARAVIDHREQHQERRPLPIHVDPGRGLQVFKVGWAHVEVPKRVRIFGLEADGGRRARHPLVVIAKPPQVAIGGRGGQRAWCQLLESIRRVDTMLDQQLQGAHCREMPALLIGGSNLHGGDDLAPALDLRGRQRSWAPAIGAMGVLRPAIAAQQAIQRGAADGVELRRGRHQSTALRMPRRQRHEAPAQSQKRLGRYAAAPRHQAPAVASAWRRDTCGRRDRAFAAVPGR